MLPNLADRRFETAEAMARVLAEEIADRLRAGLRERGSASLAVAGGTTPGELYDRLAYEPLDWSRVQVVPTDERRVSPDDPSSNERMLREHLLQGAADVARFVPLRGEPAAAAAAVAAVTRPFDVVVLGMGEDLHTASLFPAARGLAPALDPASPALVGAITAPGAAGSPERLTLTVRALLDARKIVLLLRGEAKREALQLALAAGPAASAPVRAVLHQTAVPVEICWAP
jgi:6-phosphogluconolactonase